MEAAPRFLRVALIAKERQLEGIAHVKSNGVRFGRKRALTLAQVEDLRQRRATGELIATLMYDYRLSKAALYRYLARFYVYA